MADMSKNRVMVSGYLPTFEEVRVNNSENMTLSICGHNGKDNYVKNLKYGNSMWEVE